VDEYKDNPANCRPSRDDGAEPDVKAAEEPTKPSPAADKPEPTVSSEEVGRPGFDLGGSTVEPHAGNGVGLGTDAEDGVCPDSATIRPQAEPRKHPQADHDKGRGKRLSYSKAFKPRIV
jgi:hypothetical protein